MTKTFSVQPPSVADSAHLYQIVAVEQDSNDEAKTVHFVGCAYDQQTAEIFSRAMQREEMRRSRRNTPPTPDKIEAIEPAELYARVTFSDGWIDLGYDEGTPEFTVIQITLDGDYLVTTDQLRALHLSLDAILSHQEVSHA